MSECLSFVVSLRVKSSSSSSSSSSIVVVLIGGEMCSLMEKVLVER